MAEVETSERKLEQLPTQHPLIMVVAKKNRAARKKLAKVEELEKKIASQKIKALPEQLEAIKNKQRLTYLVEDYEDTLEQMSVVAKENGEQALSTSNDKEVEKGEHCHKENTQVAQPKDISQNINQGELLVVSHVFRLSEAIYSHGTYTQSDVENALSVIPAVKFAGFLEFQTALKNFDIVRAAFCSSNLDVVQKLLKRSTENFSEGLNYATTLDQIEALCQVFELMKQNSTITAPRVTSDIANISENAEENKVEDTAESFPSETTPISPALEDQDQQIPIEDSSEREPEVLAKEQTNDTVTAIKPNKRAQRNSAPGKPVNFVVKLKEPEAPKDDPPKDNASPIIVPVQPLLPIQSQTVSRTGNAEVIVVEMVIPKYPSGQQSSRSASYEPSSKGSSRNALPGRQPQNRRYRGDESQSSQKTEPQTRTFRNRKSTEKESN